MLALVYNSSLLSCGLKLYLTDIEKKATICVSVDPSIVICIQWHSLLCLCILLPQLLHEGGIKYNLACGFSSRNDTFKRKGFIIVMLHLKQPAFLGLHSLLVCHLFQYVCNTAFTSPGYTVFTFSLDLDKPLRCDFRAG